MKRAANKMQKHKRVLLCSFQIPHLLNSPERKPYSVSLGGGKIDK